MALFSHRCPACDKGQLYDGLLRVPTTCAACGQRLADEDAGDGPAFFVILIVGCIVTAAAAAVEVYFTPPMWLHMALWTPLTLLLSLWLLRLFKAQLIALQYKSGGLPK